METEQLFVIITALVSFILGLFTKKFKWINTNLIPLQNLIIGLLMAAIEYIATKDFNGAIAVSGLLAGGTYDLFNNLTKIIKGGAADEGTN